MSTERIRLPDTIAVRVPAHLGQRLRNEAASGRQLGEVTRRYLEAGVAALDASSKTAAGSEPASAVPA